MIYNSPVNRGKAPNVYSFITCETSSKSQLRQDKRVNRNQTTGFEARLRCPTSCSSPKGPEQYLRQGGPGSGALCCHGKHGCDPQAHSGGSCIHVDPEGHPGQDDGEKAGNVHLDQVVTHLTLQVEFDLNTGEFT